MISATALEAPPRFRAGLPSGVTVSSMLHAALTDLPRHLAKVQVVELAPGVTATSHTYAADEFLYLLSGEGTVEMNGRATVLDSGSVVSVPRGRHKTLRNTSHSVPLRILAFLVVRRDPNILLLAL